MNREAHVRTPDTFPESLIPQCFGRVHVGRELIRTSIITNVGFGSSFPGTGRTRRPDCSAFAVKDCLVRSPTVTLQPDSRRLLDLAKPWLP